MKVLVLAVGRVKTASLRDACDVFASRIGRYLNLEVKEVRDAGRRESDAGVARRLESSSLSEAIPPGSHVVALSRTGRTLDSLAFAKLLDRWRQTARHVTLLLGGPHGLDDRVIRESHECISLSALTFPHDVARLVLLEQLYRACTILRGEPYHKGDRR